MKFYELWYQFSITKNTRETYNTYVNFYDECVEEKLDIISCDKNMALNMPIFKDIMNTPNIKTIFKYPNLAFFSPQIIRNMQDGQRAPLNIDFSISFESNSARYLHDYLQGNKVNENTFIDTLHSILDNNYNIDPIFYMIENFAKGNDTKEFHENLVSIKKLMTCDMQHYYLTKEIKSIHSDKEIEKIVKEESKYFKEEFKQIFEIAQEQHLIMKIIFLMIIIAKFKIQGKKEEKLKRQFKYFIEFMDKELQTIFLRELVVALNYLEYDIKGNKKEKRYSFFGNLNGTNKDKIAKDIDNMAWDFTLARQLEIYFSSKPNPNADFFLPFLFTYDKGFIEVLEDFYCKDFLIFHKEKRTIPIPENEFDMSKIEKYGLSHYFTEESFNKRIKNENIDFKKIYNNLLNEVLKLKRFN